MTWTIFSLHASTIRLNITYTFYVDCITRSFITCTWGDQVTEDEMGGTCSKHGRGEKFVRSFVGKPEGKRPLGRSRRRCKDNIRMDLKETDWESVDGMHLAQDMDQ